MKRSQTLDVLGSARQHIAYKSGVPYKKYLFRSAYFADSPR